MRAIEISFIILVFMSCMSLVVNANLFDESGAYYESEILRQYNTDSPESMSLPENISTVSETQQYSSTMNIVDVIFSSLSFGWIKQMVPYDFRDDIMPLIAVLDIISAFIMGVAIIELFTKRSIF